MGSYPVFDPENRPDDAEVRAYINEECGGELLTIYYKSGSRAKGRFHIPDQHDDGPICHTATLKDRKWRSKPLSVFPAGWRDWCVECLARTWPDRANIEVKQ